MDVGSGGGAPGIPLAAALPDRKVTLLEAERRKVGLPRRAGAQRLPNLEVVWGRAEEQETDGYGVAVAKALAPPPVGDGMAPAAGAPRRSGGALGRADGRPRRRRAESPTRSAAARPRSATASSSSPSCLATPDGFPRRPGMARKRPLA